MKKKFEYIMYIFASFGLLSALIFLIYFFIVEVEHNDKLGDDFIYIEKSALIYSKDIIIAGVFELEHDENYIIGARVSTKIYDCENSNEYKSNNKTEYILINKYNKKVYSFREKNSFELKINSLESNLFLDYEKVENKFSKQKHLYINKKTRQDIKKCRELTYKYEISY